jgi:hypothetical protein
MILAAILYILGCLLYFCVDRTSSPLLGSFETETNQRYVSILLSIIWPLIAIFFTTVTLIEFLGE